MDAYCLFPQCMLAKILPVILQVWPQAIAKLFLAGSTVEAAVSTPASVHSWCTEVPEGSCSQGLRPLWFLHLYPSSFIYLYLSVFPAQTPPVGGGVSFSGDLTETFFRHLHQDFPHWGGGGLTKMIFSTSHSDSTFQLLALSLFPPLRGKMEQRGTSTVLFLCLLALLMQ